MKGQAFSREKRDLLERLLKDEGVGDDVTPGFPSFQAVQIDGRDAFPLSFSQRRLWFLDQLEPGNAFYNFPLAVPFNAAVNAAVLERSINEIVKRHEALRTVFGSVDGEPVQIVIPALTLPLAVIDLRHLDKEAQDAEIVRLASEMTQRPFDLARGPLLRTSLLRRGQEDHIFLLVMHHIISDGWSLGIFWRELIALYNAFYVNRPSPLPDLPIQYADFAVWQRQQLQGEKLAELISYWKRQLADLPALQLPTDRPRPAMLSYRGAFQEIVIPRALTDALRTLSKREGATLFMTLFAAFTALLQRYTGQDDIAVGSYVASRDRAELEELIGFFVNSLVLRADLSGDPSFRTLLKRVREMALDAYAHQELPFEKLVEELQPERDLGRNPLFQVSFQLFSAQVERGSSRAPDNAATIDLNRGMAIFDIAVNIWDAPDGLSGHIEYSTDLFDAQTVARLAGHYRTLLKSIVTDPEAALSTLPMLDEAERRQLLVEWNETRSATPDVCVHTLFEVQVRRTPGAVAVVADGKELLYGDLNRRANRLAHRLIELGVERESLVGICVERGLDAIVGILAILKAGAAYVPLDPGYPPERLAFMLEDSDARIVLSDGRSARRLPRRSVQILLMDDESVVTGQGEMNPAVAVGPENLCYVIYTSGSTGRPKGVMAPHRSTVNRLQWMWTTYPFAAGEVVCQKAALSFVDSIWEMFGGLLQGITTVVLPDDTVKDPRKLVSALAAAKVSRIVLVPSLLRALQTSGIRLAEELPILRYWTLSGEALPYDLYVDFQREMPQAKVLNLYGSSEVAADVLCCDLSATETRSRLVPIGRPIANTQAYVLDRHHNLVPIGVPGELYIGGQALARGYHHRSELSAETFIANPFADTAGERLYKTRDQVRYRPDGQIEYLGRLDHLVKVRGYRIELGEIESVLTEHHRVSDAVVSVVQRREEDTRLVAYVVPKREGDAVVTADASQELASRWRTVWDETYLKTVDGSGSFNIVGWNSSYTGEPIPPAEMREWVDQTVDRVLTFEPRRVLEIGCGTGLILLRVAPHCERYVGTDFSEVALDQLRGEIAKAADKYQHVQLHQRAADELGGLGGPFDLIILNSVIQYFPSVDYLTRVLRAAVRLSAPTGAILVGDVRSQPLMRAFHTAVELHHAPDTLTVDALQARIQKQLGQEKELAVAPSIFHELAPEIAQVTVDLKRGTLLNEVMQFRYDVTLRRTRARTAISPERWLDWTAGELSIDKIRAMLTTDGAKILGIAGIANARVSVPMNAVALLADSQIETVGELRRRIEQLEPEAIDPETMWALGRELGYGVSIGLRSSGSDGRYDVVFQRGTPSSSFGFPSEKTGRNESEQHVTNPVAGVVTQDLIANLRTHLQQQLPDYMVPASIVLLDQLPQTPNGKVDRRALPAPDAGRSGDSSTYLAPRSRTERRLAVIWADVLDIEPIGVFDNFFELGGHSLLATQLISRIRIEFNNELPVRAVFEAPTIATLAAKLDEWAGSGESRPGRAIERLSRRAPVGRETIGQFSRDTDSGRSIAER